MGFAFNVIKTINLMGFHMMKDELKKIGSTLKTRREEMGISLKEVENTTSIRSNYLGAIEEGDMAKLISPVYAQGFIKQYSQFLGLDADKLMKEHPDVFARASRFQQQEFSYGIGTLEARGNPGHSVKWLPNLIWIGAFFLILFAAWFFARHLEVI